MSNNNFYNYDDDESLKEFETRHGRLPGFWSEKVRRGKKSEKKKKGMLKAKKQNN